jgi:hypothetical protein
MTLIAYVTAHWRYASFLCALVISPALLVVYFVLPESPTYLHKKHRLDEMAHSERRIARIGNVPYIPGGSSLMFI